MANKHTITFDADKHEYRLGEKVLISVTQLLKKHGLTADYSGVNEEVLAAKAKRGTLIHKELEKYIKTGDLGFTEEVEWFDNWVREKGAYDLESEVIVHNGTVAGTLDVRGYLGDGRRFKGDFKTSAKLDNIGVRWQLSLYDEFDVGFADVLFAFHFTDKMKPIVVQPIQQDEVKKLLDCEKRGVMYQQNSITLANDLKVAVEKWERAVSVLEQNIKQATMVRDEYRGALVTLFEQHDGVYSIETENLRITYVAPTERRTIDTTALKAKMPDIAKQFEKVTPIKSNVRVTFKGGVA